MCYLRLSSLATLLYRILSISVLCCVHLSHASVYTWVDAQGKTHYADEPPSGANATPLADNTPSLILPAPKQAASSNSSAANDNTNGKSTEKIAYQVKIITPLPEETIHNNSGDFTVNAALTPTLKSPYYMALKLNGELVGDVQIGGVFSLKNIDRGEYIITVDALTQNGKVFASSSPVKIFLHQASSK